MADMLIEPESGPDLTRDQAVAAFQRWLERNDDAQYARFTFTLQDGKPYIETREGVAFESYAATVPEAEEGEDEHA